MGGRDWTTAEERALRELIVLGKHVAARVLDRSPSSVKRKASRMGLSVKRKFEIDVPHLSPQILTMVKDHDPGLICPGCGKRFAATKDGLCGVCHKDALLEGHYVALAELDKQREINRVKQRVRRARKELGVTAPRARRQEM